MKVRLQRPVRPRRARPDVPDHVDAGGHARGSCRCPSIPLSGVWTGSGRQPAAGLRERQRRGRDGARVPPRRRPAPGALAQQRARRRADGAPRGAALAVPGDALSVDNRKVAHRGTGAASSLEHAVSIAASIAVHLVQRGLQRPAGHRPRARSTAATWHEHGALAAETAPAARAAGRAHRDRPPAHRPAVAQDVRPLRPADRGARRRRRARQARAHPDAALGLRRDGGRARRARLGARRSSAPAALTAPRQAHRPGWRRHGWRVGRRPGPRTRCPRSGRSSAPSGRSASGRPRTFATAPRPPPLTGSPHDPARRAAAGDAGCRPCWPALTTWVTLLAWTKFAENPAGFMVPILGGCLLVAVVGMLLRSARGCRPSLVALVQVVRRAAVAQPPAGRRALRSAGWCRPPTSVRAMLAAFGDSVVAADDVRRPGAAVRAGVLPAADPGRRPDRGARRLPRRRSAAGPARRPAAAGGLHRAGEHPRRRGVLAEVRRRRAVLPVPDRRRRSRSGSRTGATSCPRRPDLRHPDHPVSSQAIWASARKIGLTATGAGRRRPAADADVQRARSSAAATARRQRRRATRSRSPTRWSTSSATWSAAPTSS